MRSTAWRWGARLRVVVAAPGGSPEEYAALSEAGHDVVFGQQSKGPGTRVPVGELIELCQGADCLICIAVPREVIEALPQLASIVGPAVGIERVDLEAATENGVLVCNSPSQENVIGGSEAAIGLMLALAKRLKRKEARLRDGGWGVREDRGFLLWQQTVGIIGLGRTGSGVAKRLAGWELTLLGVDPYVSDERFAELGVQRVDVSTLLAESDFVTLHVVVTPETRKMIGDEQLRLMKPGSYLINTSRGDVVDYDAVCRAIEAETIAGAGLDVFDPEPLPLDSPLRDLDPERVILTPHNAAGTEASRAGNLRLSVENALTMMRGEVPESVKNPEVLPTWRGRTASTMAAGGAER